MRNSYAGIEHFWTNFTQIPILHSTKFFALIWAFFCTVSSAFAITPTCDQLALHANDYTRATVLIHKLPELRRWSGAHGLPVVYGSSVDKEITLNGRCYWSVTVYANRPERLELWQVFYVDLHGERVLIQDPEMSQVISLDRWRRKARQNAN